VKARLGVVMTTLIGLTALLVILPGFSVAVGPGAVYGRIPTVSPGGDMWYKTSPQTGTRGLWSTVYTFNDVNTTTWTTGYSMLDLNYRNGIPNPPGNYVYYMNYMTFPWIAITWDDENRTIYPFVDSTGSMSNQTRYNADSNVFTEGNLAPPAQPSDTNMHAAYNLDCNNDGTRDFTFELEYVLSVNLGTQKGKVLMNIRETFHPPNWVLGDKTVTYLEYAFLVNPDVVNQTNEVKWWGNGFWPDVDEEGVFTTTNGLDCIKVSNGNYEIIMKSHNNGQSSLVWYVIKYDSAGQFSQYPSAYENNEDIDGGDVEVWYIAGYSIPGNAPADVTTMEIWDIDP
jgi:hypothetical protein